MVPELHTSMILANVFYNKRSSNQIRKIPDYEISPTTAVNGSAVPDVSGFTAELNDQRSTTDGSSSLHQCPISFPMPRDTNSDSCRDIDNEDNRRHG
jgi:hypothetical protein